jgi:protocatechuate 3,4-dioxygenase beta subunit
VAADVGAAEENAPASTDQEPDTVRLVVRVQERGRPVAARLEHLALDSALSAVGEVPSDGTLVLELAPGRVRLVAWSAEALSRPLELQLAHDTEAELELLPALPVEGRIVADGAPVAGAEVAFWTASERDVVVTDAQGRFRHPRFPAGGPAQQVCVRAEGFGKCVRYLKLDADGAWTLAAARAGEASVSGSGTPFLELELARELVVRGRVLDSAGLPLAGARVAAEGYFHARPSVAVRDLVETRSDPAGAFELVGLRSDVGHALVLEAAGFATLERELPPATELALGDLVLAPESVLAGLVVDADGVPLAGAEVVLELGGEAPLAAGPTDAAARLLGRERRTRTDANGAFLFAGLAAAPLVLRAESADGSAADAELFPDGRGQFPPACLQLATLERR